MTDAPTGCVDKTVVLSHFTRVPINHSCLYVPAKIVLDRVYTRYSLLMTCVKIYCSHFEAGSFLRIASVVAVISRHNCIGHY